MNKYLYDLKDAIENLEFRIGLDVTETKKYWCNKIENANTNAELEKLELEMKLEIQKLEMEV